MVKVRALITLVVGKQQEVPPGTICDVSEDEAKRLILLEFAERLKKEPVVNIQPNSNKNQTEGNPDDKPDANGGGQPVQPTGTDGNLQK